MEKENLKEQADLSKIKIFKDTLRKYYEHSFYFSLDSHDESKPKLPLTDVQYSFDGRLVLLAALDEPMNATFALKRIKSIEEYINPLSVVLCDYKDTYRLLGHRRDIVNKQIIFDLEKIKD